MGVYSIRDLEILSGIKAHTLRIWEQRYGIIDPKRTDTNIRFYDDEDLKRILNISLLNQNGYKISKIAEMSDNEMTKEVVTLSEKNFKYPDQINMLVHCMVNLDKDLFEKAMSKSILQHGFENTMIHIVFPFLNKVGLLWLTGSISPAQEHFISHLIRKKIMVALDGQITKRNEGSKKFMLFLPDGDFHELGLLFASYMIKSKGHDVLYLGQSLPLEHVADAYYQYKPNYIFTVYTAVPANFEVQEHVNLLAEKFNDCHIYTTGYQVVGQGINPPKNVKIIARLEEFVSILDDGLD
ncbi:MAG: MerR family transcriptional regulator [Cytophagales bacterium]